MFYVWLVIIVLGLIAKLIKPMYLFGACFSLAGVLPFFLSIASIESSWYIAVQILLFAVTVLLLIFLLRKRAINWIKQYSEQLKTKRTESAMNGENSSDEKVASSSENEKEKLNKKREIEGAEDRKSVSKNAEKIVDKIDGEKNKTSDKKDAN